MLNVIRRSQLQGLVVLDSATVSHLGEIEEVWLNETGRVVYLSGKAGYLPLEQVADINHQALSTYGRLLIDAPQNLQRFDQLAVHSTAGESLGWVEDFLFDWHTGEIAAYVLAGKIADPLGEFAVLYPDEVEAIATDFLVIREGAQNSVKPESEELRGFLSEQSHQVRHLVKVIGDRLHHLISPHDHPDVVRVKVKAVSDEMAESETHDQTALEAATAYLHEQWESLQQTISRSGSRAKVAMDSAWKYLTGHG